MYKLEAMIRSFFLFFLIFLLFCAFCDKKAASAPAPKGRGAPDKLTLEKLQGLWVGDYNTNKEKPNPRSLTWDIWEDVLTENDGVIAHVEIDKVTNEQILGRQIFAYTTSDLRVWEINISYFNYQKGQLEGTYVMFTYELDRYSILRKKPMGTFNFTLRRQ